jgi:hypothetical protein
MSRSESPGIHVLFGSITCVVASQDVPRRDQLPWQDAECDAFVAILADGLLTDQVTKAVSTSLVELPTDWIETMGSRAEFLHDRIDDASVAVGRQNRVGEGSPMTAWHEDLADINAMIEYVRLGGLGASNNKLVVVIGPEAASQQFADRLGRTSRE